MIARSDVTIATMFYNTHQPTYPLSRFIEHFWYHDGYCPGHNKQRLLPDGTSELVIDLRPQPKKLFDRDDHTKHTSFRESWISGKQSRYIVIESACDSSMIGVHFRPGGTYPFLGFPLAELTDQVVELDLLWGRAVYTLREQILEALGVDQKFAVLERFLMSKFDANRTAMGRVEQAIDQVLRSPHGMTMRDIAWRIGITPKHLISLFDKFIGLKPKAFGRICRFQRALHVIEHDSPVAWSQVAARTGHSDQAHLIKEFRHFSGLTPSHYVNQKSEFFGFVPISE